VVENLPAPQAAQVLSLEALPAAAEKPAAQLVHA
jgi:hypothetical protein